MSKKKRRFEQLEAAAAAPKEKKIYVDPLQEQIVPRIEEAGKVFEGKGKTILYAVGALVVLAIVVLVFMNWSKRSGGAAQTALGKAIEVSRSRVTETPAPAGSTVKTFKSEKERAEAAIAEFQKVADTYGGEVGEKAKYFIAVNRLFVDRPTAISELEGAAASSSKTGILAKFALAQTRADDGLLDEAATIYQELLALNDPILARDTINFELAAIYVKQDKKQEASDIYFNIAKAASEAKDLDGNPVTPTQTVTDSKTKLKELDPERAKEIPEPTPESPFGGSGAPPISIQ